MSRLPSAPILDREQTARLEAALFGGDEGKEWLAMTGVGRALAAAVEQDFEEIGPFPAEATLLVLVGKGHNGGDALLAAAEFLVRHPRARAEVIFVFGERSLRPLAARAWRQLLAAGPGRVQALDPGAAGQGGPATVVLDGVFGFNFRPPLPPAAAAVLRAVNARPAGLRAAVDLPSGLDAPEAFRADFTYATGVLKREALAAENSGRIRFLDRGFFAADAEPSAPDRVLTAEVLAPLRALRPARGDKRHYGHVAIVGGSRSYPGAVLMNVLAALHSGAGLVTVFVPESLAAPYAARAPEAMWVGCPETPDGAVALEARGLIAEKLSRATALAMGSGLSREAETAALVRELLGAYSGPVLLDGDALQPELVRAARRAALVLTPHAGEFERIAGKDADLRAFAAQCGGAVALKGPITRVCGGSTVYHSVFGGPVLARGGSGDLLAGLAAGQLAMLAAEGVDEAAVTAAARAVVWHGLAADLLARRRGQTAVAVTELAALLSDALRQG